MKFSFNKKKLQYGSASVMFTVLFVAVVVVINIFAEFMTDRFSLKLDMTESGQYSLSEQTRDMLGSLENEVTVYILAARSDMEKNENAKLTLETIQRYNSASGGKVKYEFIDPDKNPQFFQKYTKAKNAKRRDIVVEGPERYIVVESSKFAYQVGNQNKTYYQSEEKISGAILYVSSAEVTGAGFVVGHGEIQPDALLSHFEGNNFEIAEVDLLSGIPEGITNLVISAPRADFTAAEIDVLEKYLSGANHNLYVFWSMETPALSVIERYLSEWGIVFASQVVCDESNAYMSPGIVVSDLVETAIVDKALQGQSYVLSPEARPIELLWPASGYTSTSALVKTRDTSYAKLISADKTIEEFTRSAGDESGPFITAAVAERALGSSMDSGVSRVAVFGSYAMALEEITGVPRAFNGTLLARLTDYLNPNTKTMEIAPKVVSDYDLNITENGARLLQIILIAVIPAVIILAGIFIFMKRKNR